MWIRVLVVGLLAATVLVGLGFGAVTWRWVSSSDELASRLEVPTSPATPFDRSTLPEPVARYLARAVPIGAPEVASARIMQAGHFHLGDGDDAWKPFTALEVFRVSEPGFMWDAKIRMAPGLSVRVRDAFVDGMASMEGRVAGVVPVMDLGHSTELAEGALSRYLAEAVWIPTRLATVEGLTWEAIGPDRAAATLESQGTRVRVEFTFDAEGDPIEVRAIRQREVDGRFELTPWVGRFSDHRDAGGFRIPFAGEVAWVVDGEEALYWRGRITTVEWGSVQPPA